MSYYADKVESLSDLFGSEVKLDGDHSLVCGEHRFPIVDDVIVVLDPGQYPTGLRRRATASPGDPAPPDGFAEEIQFSFGAEWTRFPEILPEHEREFADRFFTGIELRVTRAENRLQDPFASGRVSDGIPYWHFLCRR